MNILASFVLLILGVFYFLLGNEISKKFKKAQNFLTTTYSYREMGKVFKNIKNQQIISEILIALIFSIISVMVTLNIT